MRAQYKKLRAAGICTQCGTRPATTARCEQCKAERRAKSEEWKAAGLCGQCGGKRKSGGYKLCKRHVASTAMYRKRNPERARELENENYRRARDEARRRYGETCSCCGESERLFLAIDHIENDGAQRRRNNHNDNDARNLRLRGWPSGYQTLCQNCNWGKYLNGGVCPHQN